MVPSNNEGRSQRRLLSWIADEDSSSAMDRLYRSQYLYRLGLTPSGLATQPLRVAIYQVLPKGSVLAPHRSPEG